MDVGQGREQDAEAFQQELHNAAMRPLLRLEDEQNCCAISGSYLWTTPKLLVRLAKVDVLILDDWGLSRLIVEQRRDLLEIMEDRHDNRSTIVTSQLPLEKWHNSIGDPPWRMPFWIISYTMPTRSI